jgi:hypothetical protein
MKGLFKVEELIRAHRPCKTKIIGPYSENESCETLTFHPGSKNIPFFKNRDLT